MTYKILASDWYTDQLGHTIGVVAIASGPSKENWKAYIAVVSGINEKFDEQLIAQSGGKLLPASVACAHFPSLPPEGFVY